MKTRRTRRYQLALAGHAPAEELSTSERERLVAELVDTGMTDVEIAEHTRMTTYTTVRIRTRIGSGLDTTRR